VRSTDSPGQPEPRGLERVDWKSLGDVVEVADYSGLGRFILHTDNYPQEISSLQCTPGSLEAIGVRAVMGRVFLVEDFRPGGEHVIMISNALWRERFGASPSVLGETIRVSAANSGETPTDIASFGVLPPGFRHVGNYIRDPADTAMPLTAPRQAYMVRLREGVPATLAERRITEAVRSVASAIPNGLAGREIGISSRALHRDMRPVLIGVNVASALVLLIVVTNIVVLMLLRALRRPKGNFGSHRAGSRATSDRTPAPCGSGINLQRRTPAGVAVTMITLRALGSQIEARLGRPVPGGVSALAMDGTFCSGLVALAC